MLLCAHDLAEARIPRRVIGVDKIHRSALPAEVHVFGLRTEDHHARRMVHGKRIIDNRVK